MTQWIKVLVAKHDDDLSFSLRICMIDGEDQLFQIAFLPLHVHHGAPTYACIQNNYINVKWNQVELSPCQSFMSLEFLEGDCYCPANSSSLKESCLGQMLCRKTSLGVVEAGFWPDRFSGQLARDPWAMILRDFDLNFLVDKDDINDCSIPLFCEKTMRQKHFKGFCFGLVCSCCSFIYLFLTGFFCVALSVLKLTL